MGGATPAACHVSAKAGGSVSAIGVGVHGVARTASASGSGSSATPCGKTAGCTRAHLGVRRAGVRPVHERHQDALHCVDAPVGGRPSGLLDLRYHPNLGPGSTAPAHAHAVSSAGLCPQRCGQ
jgi:hypothetical protein